MSKEIVVQVSKQTDAYVKGAELGFASEAKAASVLGDGNFKVIGYQDKSPMEVKTPTARQDAPDASKSEKKG